MSDCRKGQRLGEYRIVAEVGKGPFTFACLAETMVLPRRQVVVKGLHVPELAPLFREHLRQWAGRTLALEGMADVLDLVEEGERVFGILTYEPGGALADRWEDLQKESLGRRLDLLETLATTLDALHEGEGAPYGSLHLRNVLVRLNHQGHVQALVLDIPGIRTTALGSFTRTAAPAFALAPERALYLAPEQARGEDPTPASDRYAFAALAYHLLTGEPPFAAQDTAALYEKHLHAPAPTPPGLEEAAPLFRRALAKAPSERYPSCRALLEDLRPVVQRREQARWEGILRGLQEALHRQNPQAARQALEELRRMRPEAPEVERLGWEVENLEKALRAYERAAQALRQARTQARELRQAAPVLDPAGLRARLAPGPGLRPRELGRRFRAGLVVWLLAVLLLALWAGAFALDHTTASPGFQTPAAALIAWTATPTLTPTLTPTPKWPVLSGTPLPPLRTTIGAAGADRLIPLRILSGRNSWSVLSVAFSSDGRLLASGDGWPSYTVRLWDVTTGESVAMLQGHGGAVFSVAFSPDGRLLASGSWDGTVRLWDVQTGEAVAMLQGHTGSVSSVAFSPDGRLLASGLLDHTVRLWDVRTGKSVAVFQGHTGSVRSVAFSPDGRLLASGSWDNTVRLWDVRAHASVAMLRGHGDAVFSVAFSPDGRLLASGSGDNTIRLWDVATGETVAVLQGHTGSVRSVAFAPDGRLLASGANDRTVRLWDMQTGEAVAVLQGHGGTVSSVAFSPDGLLLASGADDHTIILWAVP